MAITRFTAEHAAAVAAFNARIRAGGSPFQLPTSPAPALDGFLALDGATVRGGYFVKHQPFLVDGSIRRVAHLQLPVSEGSVDERYSPVGVHILLHAQRCHPFLYALGMGGLDQPLPQMLSRMGWRLGLVPFFFRVVRAAPFLRNIVPLRTTPQRRLAADLLAATGVGDALVAAWNLAHSSASLRRTHVAESVVAFGDWADDVWQRARPTLLFAAQRDAAELDRLYPPSDPRFLRLRVLSRQSTVGWAVLLATDMRDHKQFGSMRVGTVVDCLAVPGHERAVVHAATRDLARRGVAVIITNQQHAAWTAAFSRAGYVRAPSNYAFGASKKLAAALASDPACARVHMTRGDGSGPIHL